jgi:hypothetical protein
MSTGLGRIRAGGFTKAHGRRALWWRVPESACAHIGCALLCATNPTRWSSTADFMVEPTPSNAFGASVTDGIEHLFDRPGGHLLRGPGRRIPTGFVISIVFAPAGTNPWARSFVSALQGRDWSPDFLPVSPFQSASTGVTKSRVSCPTPRQRSTIDARLLHRTASGHFGRCRR